MESEEASEFAGEEISKHIIKVSHEAKLKELLRNLTSIELKLCSDASKEFIKLLKGDGGGELLREYIQTSSKCAEILQAWKLRQGKPGLSSIFSLISAILSHRDGLYKVNDMGGTFISRALDKFAKLILEAKLDDVYKELNSREAKRQNAALLLLSCIVSRGSGLASDVVKVFDFKLPIFPKLAEYRKRQTEVKRKHLTRKSFVRFAMSFLEVGKPGLLRWVLQQREMYSGVLRGLGSDDEETVVYVLSILRDKILVQESLVPPGLRSVLFGSVTLDQLIGISGRENGGLATELAQQVLYIVCTDPSNGLMPDMKRQPNPLKGNLTRLLGVMKKLKATEVEYQRNLLLAIVKGKPSFGSRYLEEFPYYLEDHASPTWFAAISLAANVVSSVGEGVPFGFLDSHPQEPPSFSSPDVQSIIKCIGPRPFTRLVINKGLLHSDPLIKHGTLRLVFEALKLLDSFINALNCSSHTSSQIMPRWAYLKKDIENEVRILLPDPQVLFSLLSSICNRFKSLQLCLKRAADPEIVSEPINGNKKLKTCNESEETDIIVGGINSSPDISLHGDTEELPRTNSLDELDNGALVEHIKKIWGMHHCTIAGMTPEDEETYFYSKLLDSFKLYHRAIPIVLDGSFDFLKVLPSNALALPPILQQSLLSLLIEYIGWSSTCEVPVRIPPLMYKHLHILLNFLLYSPIKEIRDQAYLLAQAAMLSTGAFDKNPTEIGTWFLFLPGYSGKIDNLFNDEHGINVIQNVSSVVVSFLCDAVSTTGNNLFKYWDILWGHIYHLKGAIDLSPDFSPLVLCVLGKCLRLLRAESGAFSLPEKAMISLYVSNTLRYLLQTQVEPGLLSSIVSLLLSDRLGGHCSVVDISLDLCEWRPLKNLVIFLESIEHQQACSIPSVVEDLVSSESSLVNAIDNIKEAVRKGHAGVLIEISTAFSFSMLCTKFAEILQNFPSVVTLSNNLLGVPMPLLLSIFFLEQGLLHDVSLIWPEMFFASLEKIVTVINSEGQMESSIDKDDNNSVECSSVAFAFLLKQAPFYVLFPALLGIEWSHMLDNTKLKDLVLAKLCEGRADICFNNFRLVFFWLHQIQLSYRLKPSDDLIRLSEFCFIVLQGMLTQLFSEKSDFGSKISCLPLAQCMLKVAEIMFCHPAVTEALECSFTGSKEFPDNIFEVSSEDFLRLSSQGVHSFDYHIWNLVGTTCYHLSTFSNFSNSVLEVYPEDKRVIGALNFLVEKLLLILKDRFDQGVKVKDFTPLIPTLYALHSLIHFISPLKLLELAHHILSRIELNGYAVQKRSTKHSLCIGLCIAGRSFDLLSVYLQKPYKKGKLLGLMGEEDEKIVVTLFERIYFRVVEIASQCELDIADLCLLKAINVGRTNKMMQKPHLPFCLAVSRVIGSTPIKFLNHCIQQTSMNKARLLFSLTEVSPLHLSVFGQLLSELMNNYSHYTGKMVQACSYTLSADDFLILLPTVLSYLNSTSIESEKQYYKIDIPHFYWKCLSHGFSNWKNYTSRDIFQVEIGEFLPSSLEELLNLVQDSLLGKVIFIVHTYLTSNENSVKLKQRLRLFDSVCPSTGTHGDFLECDVSEMNGYSYCQSLIVLTKTVTKIDLCRILLFPEVNKFQSLSKPGEDDDSGAKVIPSEIGSDKLYMRRTKFVDKLVYAWSLLVKHFPLKLDHLRNVEGTNNRSLFRLLEVFILRNILQLMCEINKDFSTLDSLPYIEKLVRFSLLHRFEDPTTFRMLQGVLTLTSEGKLTHILVLKLLLAHSQFTSTIAAASRSYGKSHCGIVFKPMSSILRSLALCLPTRDPILRENHLQTSDTYKKQLEVLKLLRILFSLKTGQSSTDFEEDIGINSKELLLLLLSSYSATVSEIDLEIYSLIRVIESTFESSSSFTAEMDYLWGSAAVKVRKEREKEHDVSSGNIVGIEDIEEHRRNEFRENLPIDPKVCANTVLYFPYDRTVDEGTLVFDKLRKRDSSTIEKPQVYDPVFILRFSIHNLSIGYIEPLEFANCGLLAVAFVSMSSPEDEIRRLGYETLGRFKNTLEKCPKRKDVTRLRLLLTYLQNGIEEAWQRVPSVTAMFLAEASLILLDPSNDHYLLISKLLVRSSCMNMKSIPLFENCFWSSSVNFKTDRLWILRLLYAGLTLDDDAQLYIRDSIPEILMSFYTSPLSDNESKELILQILKKSVKLQKLLHYVVEQCGLISWLSSIISFFYEMQYHKKRSLMFTQLAVVLEVVNDVLSCRNINDWLQKCALEQVTELSSHLYKLLVCDTILMKEKVSLVSSILNVLRSTLRISQKREVCQPHLTLSMEGIFQIYEIVHLCSDGKYSPNAEIGLEAILMNTPPVTLIHMSGEKLLSFVLWAISTALQSNSTTALSSKESYYQFMNIQREEKSEECLVSRLLRWLTASIIHGKLSEKLKCLDFSIFCKTSSPLNFFFDQNDGAHVEDKADFGSEEILAAAVFYLQQLLRRKCIVLPSVVSALCLLLFSDHFLTGCEILNSDYAGRYSVIGAQPTMEIVAKENVVTIMDHHEGRKTEEIVQDPMVVPRRIMENWKPQRIDELPDAFCGGWVGYFSYDTVRYVEKKKLPFSNAPEDDRNLPDLHLGLYDDVIVFDHVEKKACVIHWVHLDRFPSVEDAFNDGIDRLETLVSRVHDIVPPRLAAGSIKLYTSLFGPSLKNSTMSSEAYKNAVLQAKEHILAGDIFQIVLSQRFERRTFADPFEVYRALRIVNPSPYMTYLQARGCILVASSPEILTRIKKRNITNRPLAGTIRRGKTPKEDYMLENQLLHDEKQCAEHIMLVDLGRNDVGKVSKPGSVTVEKLMNIERYSHVMHISSTVTGELLDDLTGWDALRAALPVGTVSGAPKVKAMELIDQLEVTRRGPYSGGFGGISFSGDMDIALALRTIVFPTGMRHDTMFSYKDANKRRDWIAHLQAGAGIVADSDPGEEQRECENKAAALARAIDLAESSFVEK